MKVLIACEFSGIVRDAFTAKGHDAWSCDILPTERPGNHYQGDVREMLSDGWDLMIGHPPCTYLSFAGNRHWEQPGRARKRLEALDFFLNLWEAPIEKICLENPLGIASSVINKNHQIIEPFYFGDDARKRTCLWLKNLPPLKYSLKSNLFETATAVPPPAPHHISISGKAIHFTEAIIGFGSDSGKSRSKTFQGIANTMAAQWS